MPWKSPGVAGVGLPGEKLPYYGIIAMIAQFPRVSRGDDAFPFFI
jgi:hypothetical protein